MLVAVIIILLIVSVSAIACCAYLIQEKMKTEGALQNEIIENANLTSRITSAEQISNSQMVALQNAEAQMKALKNAEVLSVSPDDTDRLLVVDRVASVGEWRISYKPYTSGIVITCGNSEMKLARKELLDIMTRLGMIKVIRRQA